MGTPSEQIHFAEKKGGDQKGEVGMVVGYPEFAEPTEYGPGGCGVYSMSTQDTTTKISHCSRYVRSLCACFPQMSTFAELKRAANNVLTAVGNAQRGFQDLLKGAPKAKEFVRTRLQIEADHDAMQDQKERLTSLVTYFQEAEETEETSSSSSSSSSVSSTSGSSSSSS